MKRMVLFVMLRRVILKWQQNQSGNMKIFADFLNKL